MAIKFRFWPLLLASSWVAAQGLFSTPPSVHCSTTSAATPVLMSQCVPEALTVTDAHGTLRPLLSYKAPLEILVVFFFSSTCPSQHLGDFHVFYNKFKEWHVAFVAVAQDHDDLTAQLKKVALENIPIVYDDSGKVLHLLNPPGTPWLAVLDEDSHLRYRGPLQTPDTDEAMDAIIGHVKPVLNPEPGGVPECARQ